MQRAVAVFCERLCLGLEHQQSQLRVRQFFMVVSPSGFNDGTGLRLVSKVCAAVRRSATVKALVDPVLLGICLALFFMPSHAGSVGPSQMPLRVYFMPFSPAICSSPLLGTIASSLRAAQPESEGPATRPGHYRVVVDHDARAPHGGHFS